MAQMTPEMDTRLTTALEKDKILQWYNQGHVKIVRQVANELQMKEYIVDAHVRAISGAGYLRLQKSGGIQVRAGYYQITDKGRDFIKSGGFKEQARNQNEKELAEIEINERIEATKAQTDKERFDLEREKFDLEKRKFSLSKYAIWIAIGSLILTSANFFYGLNKDSRLKEIEKQLPVLETKDDQIENQIETLKNQFLELKSDTTGK